MEEGKTNIHRIKRQILSERGLVSTPQRKVYHRAEVPKPYHMTPMMKLIELRYSKSLEQLLWKYPTESEVASYLGIDVTTVSKWRKKILSLKEGE